MMQNCVICGTEFSKNKWNQIYCSTKCKGASRNLNQVLNCVICGNKFRKLGHTTTCSIECSKQDRIEYMKPYRQKPEARARRKVLRSTPEAKEKHARESRLRSQRPEVKAKNKKFTQQKTAQFKLEVFTHYSKIISNSDVPMCACCKYDDIRFLTLDHIEGRKHLPKKEQKLKTLGLWRHVKKIGLPKGYQVLCYNCNIAKSTSLYCPHQLDRMNEN